MRYLRAVLFLVLSILVPCAAHAQGSCPTGTNYIDLASPTNGNGYGSVAMTAANAGGITTGCWYFSSSGSSSNTGTSEASPCLYLPGMPNAPGSGSCHITPSAGEGFIIEGGSVYHRSTGSPLTGGTWTWSSSGNSSNYIYIGIDPTWEIGGGSFTRPVLNQDNPLTTSAPSSCSFSDDGTTLMSVTGSYVIVDGLEATGNCLSSTGVDSVFAPGTNDHQVFERDYVHGWSSTAGAADDAGNKFGPNGTGNPHDTTDRFLFDVVDGIDSTYGATCTTPSCIANGHATGWAFQTAWDIEFSVIHHASNGIESGENGNLIGSDLEYLFEPSISGRHGNIDETVGSNGCTTTPGYFYDNTFANFNEGNGIVIQCMTYYIFNNVYFNDAHGGTPQPDPNAFNLSGPDLGTCPGANSVITAYFYNNTMQDAEMQAGPCASNNEGGWASGSTIHWENNHIMDFTSMSKFFSCDSGNSCAQVDNGGHIFMTTAVANADGYTISNDYAPTSSSSPTVGIGKDNTSFCTSIPNAAAASACAGGAPATVREIAAWGGQFAYYPNLAVNVREAGSWDAGAYQYSASVSGPPSAASGTAALVK